MGRLGGHFHMAASAHFVFERDNHGVAFAFEKTLEPAQQILLDLASDLGTLFCQPFQLRLQSR
jgi:hypothetical protein